MTTELPGNLYRRCLDQLDNFQPVQLRGRLLRATGLTLEAVGCRLQTGQRCMILPSRGQPVDAEVVGFDRDRLFLMPLDRARGPEPG